MSLEPSIYLVLTGPLIKSQPFCGVYIGYTFIHSIKIPDEDAES